MAGSIGPTGKCCKICDRKFFVWATYSKYMDAMDQQQRILQENQQLAIKKSNQYRHDKVTLIELKNQHEQLEVQLKDNEKDYKQ